MNKKLLLAIAALSAAAASAQAPIGTVTSVNGVVTVTTGTTGTAIAAGAPVLAGSRVITTSTGSATLRLNDGCVITVPAGHALTVVAGRTCEQLRGAMQRVTTTVTTTTNTVATRIPVGTGFAPAAGAIPAFAGLLAAAVIASEVADDDAPLSPR